MTSDKRNPGAINYFHRKIRNFDDIYLDKPGLRRFLNNTIRTSVKARFDHAFDILGDLEGKTILDIGCGSGRYMFEAIKRGASFATGLDAAAGAVEYAGNLASEQGFSDKTEFQKTDFLDFYPERKFDIVFAVGYFDYIFDPAAHLRKMTELANQIIYASFPKLWSFWTPVRKIRLALNGCPVRFYTKRAIDEITGELGIVNPELKSIFRDNILIIRK